MLLNANPFNPLKTSLGDEFPSPDKVEGVRPAGYQANRVAAAAMALTMASASTGFRSVEKAWAGKIVAVLKSGLCCCVFMLSASVAATGVLLTQRHVFFNTRDNNYVLSLGFFKWATMAVPTSPTRHGDQAGRHPKLMRNEICTALESNHSYPETIVIR